MVMANVLYLVSLPPHVDPYELPLLIATSIRACSRYIGCDHSALVYALRRSKIAYCKGYQIERVYIPPAQEKRTQAKKNPRGGENQSNT